MSSSTIRQFFEQEEMNSDKLGSVDEDLNSDRASTKVLQTKEKKKKKIKKFKVVNLMKIIIMKKKFFQNQNKI